MQFKDIDALSVKKTLSIKNKGKLVKKNFTSSPFGG
jgi:hypothetical protein